MYNRIIYSGLLLLVILTTLLTSVIGCDALPSVLQNNDPSNGTSKLRKFWYYEGNTLQAVDLRVVKAWEGSSQSREIDYRAEKAPWILNAKFTNTSRLSSEYDLQLGKKTQSGISIGVPMNQHGSEFSALVNDTGDYIIIIQASGVDWWVKVGIE